MMPLPFFFWAELLSLIVSIAVFRKLQGSFYLWFIPFLILIVGIEIGGLYIKNVLGERNGWLYNLSLLIEFPFLLLLFRNQAEAKATKKLITVILILFSVFASLNITVIQGFWNFNNYTLIAGAFSMITCACLHFYEILKYKTVDNLLRSAMFWIASACLFYFSGIFLYFSLYGHLAKITSSTNIRLFATINLNLIVLFYTFISIALLVYNKKKA